MANFIYNVKYILKIKLYLFRVVIILPLIVFREQKLNVKIILKCFKCHSRNAALHCFFLQECGHTDRTTDVSLFFFFFVEMTV